MKIIDIFNHKNGFEIIKDNPIWEEIESTFNSCNLELGIDKPKTIKSYISIRFNQLGWADRVKINPTSNLTINFTKNYVGICFQIGNVARTYADLLKIMYMYQNEIIKVGIFIVPSTNASKLMGMNYANYGRLVKEFILFKDIVIAPTVILSLSNS